MNVGGGALPPCVSRSTLISSAGGASAADIVPFRRRTPTGLEGMAMPTSPLTRHNGQLSRAADYATLVIG